MSAIEVAQRYFDAWNSRDPGAIVATFAEGGTYSDPNVEGLKGSAIGDYAGVLFGAFPDLSFDIVSKAETGDGVVAAQWLMRGTNSGSLAGAPPTGGTIAQPGADFIEVENGKIRSVTGYFDRRTLVEQLGLQVLVQPYALGPVSFGASAYMNLGGRTKPGAFGITMIENRSEEEALETDRFGRRIFQDLAKMPGFISVVTARAGMHAFTITAWEDADSPKQLLAGGAHGEAMVRLFGPDFAAGAMTSVWVPDHINPLWVRCPKCNQMADADRPEGKCECGENLPEAPAYW